MSSSLVFIHIGPAIPTFAADAIRQAALFSSGPIYLVADAAALSAFVVSDIDRVIMVPREELGLSPVHQAFRKMSPFDMGFRDGFWTHTIERFFYLAALAEQRGLENGIHLESDVMLYADVDPLALKLGGLYQGIAVPFDNDDRAVASVMFWRRPQALAVFCQFVVDYLAEHPDPSLNDMAFFAQARRCLGRDDIDSLPVLPKLYAGPLRTASGLETREPELFSRNAENLAVVFDAAAIGQYLGGPDAKNFIPRKRFWYQPPRVGRPKPAPGTGFINETTIFNPSAFSYDWLVDSEGRKIPHMVVGDARVPIANLHIHRKDLKKFASDALMSPCSPITPPVVPADEIISGERLQAVADVAVITDEKAAFHTSLPKMKLAHFAPDLAPDAAGLAALKRVRSVFVYAEMIDAFVDRILPLLDQPIVLVTHNGDAGVDERYRSTLDSPRIIHWFAQNATLRHPKLTALPIGIANAQWRHGDFVALARTASRPIPKRPGLYVNFEVGTNPRVRGPLLAALAQKPFAIMGRKRTVSSYVRQGLSVVSGRPFVDKGKAKPYEDYLAEMANWRFAVSPPGNGIDCHRTWEALYLGVIPVISPPLGGLLDGLPAIIVDDFSKVTLESLEAEMEHLEGPFAWEKLTMAYWRERIRQKAAGLD